MVIKKRVFKQIKEKKIKRFTVNHLLSLNFTVFKSKLDNFVFLIQIVTINFYENVRIHLRDC